MKRLVKSVRNQLLLAILMLAFSAYSQAQNPVLLSMSVKPAKIPAGGKLTAQISASISGNWHMYSITQGAGGPIPTRITVAEGSVFKAAGGIGGSAPKREMDPNFGIMTEFYAGSASFSVPVAVDASTPPGAQTLTINVRYQVCNDTTCLPPKTIKVSASVEIIAGAAITSVSPTPLASATPTPTPNTNANSAANANKNVNVNINTNANITANANTAENTNTEIPVAVTENPNLPSDTSNDSTTNLTANLTNGLDKDQSIWSFIWLAMTVGALSLLTPCVFPMIPITVSYFTNHSAGHRSKAVKLASIYSLGIIATFTFLGMLLAIFVGAAGINLFAANPYVNLLIAGIFLFFAFNLFGAYEINVPTNVLTRLDNLTRSKEGEGSGIVGALLMGLTFTLTSFTCTSPFVGTILVSTANGEWQMPLLGMLAFSTVFALPFFVLALVPQWVSQLPRAGGWMNSIKVSMGFLEVAAAMKFISNVDLVWKWNVFTREIVLAVWIALGIILAVYLLGKFQLFHDTKPERIGAIRLVSAIISLAISFYLLTGLFGTRLGELESFLPPMTENALANRSAKASNEIEWIKNDYEKALLLAKESNKKIFINFTGYTCTNCRWMEANMFTRADVKEKLEKFVCVELFTDGEGEIYQKQQRFQEQTFQTVALPFYVVADAQGQPITTFPGLTREPAEFISFLQKGES